MTNENPFDRKNTGRQVVINGIVKPLSEWARESGISYQLLEYRIKQGYPSNKLFEKPRGYKMRLSHASVIDFWSQVRVETPTNPDSCWIFHGPIDANGYGIYRGILAHRIAATIYLQMIPGKITKKCNNRLCVRRDHFLSIGWSKEDNEVSQHRTNILAARGRGKYTIESIAKQLNVSKRIVKVILRESALYDILADIRNYVVNNREVPICPDTRLHTAIGA